MKGVLEVAKKKKKDVWICHQYRYLRCHEYQYYETLYKTQKYLC